MIWTRRIGTVILAITINHFAIERFGAWGWAIGIPAAMILGMLLAFAEDRPE